jgi:outer membrane protein OmpA-like peptidoglycan-associated protein
MGGSVLSSLASKVGLPGSVVTSALAYMIPQVVDKLTPDGVVPEESSMLSTIGDFLSGWGGAAVGAVGAVAGLAGSAFGGATDKVGDVAGAGVDAGKKVVGNAVNMVGGAMDDVTDGGGGILKWLLPLLLLGGLLLLGYWFCGKTAVAPVGNANTNVNKTNVTVNVSNTNTTNTNVVAGADRKLSDVTLPNGTKLQAYPGGIEDQLVKFIQSDEYKNGTEETLKAKWFNFDDLNFVMGKTELAPESKRQLDNITAILKAFPDVKMKIGGYTDKVGNDASNLKLSDNRAKAVQASLAKEGVGGQVPQAEGYGETQATVAETASDAERKVDRKTAVRLMKGDGATKPATANTNTVANVKPAAANTNVAAANTAK